MKILAFSDLHESYTFLRKINAAIYKIRPDVILIAGDFLNYGNNSLDYATEVLHEIIKTKIKIFAIRGNSDHKDILNLFDKYNLNLENRSIAHNNETFSGFSPDPTTALNENFKIEDSIVMSHYPINIPTQKLSGSPKIWISGHLHRFKCVESNDTLYVQLPLANTLKVALIDSEKKSAKLLNIK